ncbi:hypothetical protein [Planococcus halotolerans]|uniref:Uncharacterized protein n=2 Tax=Planococcus halotolerans TaxID=2233542 RepID=A0A365L7L2_9BACL|nr:hypothetical protein DP120_03590 [Planococcus halotolerans]
MHSSDDGREHALEDILNKAELDSSREIRDKIMETNLYSVYVLSSAKSEKAPHEAVLIEHPPASEPKAFLLPVKITALTTKMERNQKIMEAVQEHFAKPD